MQNTIQFKYNKGFAYISGIGLFLINVFLFLLIYNDTRSDDVKNKLYLCNGVLLLVFIVFLLNVFIPAVKGKVALELSNEGIFDNARNHYVSWENVKELRLQNFRNSAGISVYLFSKESFIANLNIFQKVFYYTIGWWNNTPFIILLQYVEGNNEVIFENVKSFFENIKVDSLKGSDNSGI